jgi:hypothetical protein
VEALMPIEEIEGNPWADTPTAAQGTVTEIEGNPWETPSLGARVGATALDVGASIPTGAAETLLSGTGTLGNIGQAIRSGAQRLGLDPNIVQSGLRGIPGPFGMLGRLLADAPTTAQTTPVQNALYQPKTTWGEYGRTVGNFAPFLFGGEGALLPRVATDVLAPALASETAGRAVKGSSYEPYVRMGVAALTGGVGGGLKRGPEGVTPTEAIANARKAYNSPDVVQGRFAANALPDFANNAENELRTRYNIGRPAGASPAFTALDNLRNFDKPGTTIQQLRDIQESLGNAQKRGGSDGYVAGLVKRQIGDFLDNLTPNHLVAGDASKIGPILRAANQDYAAAQAALEVPKTVKQLQKFATDRRVSPGQALGLPNLPAGVRALQPAEKEVAAKAAGGGIGTKIARGLEKLDPTQSLTGAVIHGLFHTATGGLALPLAPVGIVAGRAAKAAEEAHLEDLRRMILGRSYTAQQQGLPPPVGWPARFFPQVARGGILGGFGGSVGSPQ